MSFSLTAQENVSACPECTLCASFSRTRSFYVPDDASACVVHKLYTHLCDTSSRTCEQKSDHPDICACVRITCSAQNSGDLDELDGDFSGLHVD
jgi:hypothetical protein